MIKERKLLQIWAKCNNHINCLRPGGFPVGGPCVSWAAGLELVRAVVAEVVMALQVRMGVDPGNHNVNNNRYYYYYSDCLLSIQCSPR